FLAGPGWQVAALPPPAIHAEKERPRSSRRARRLRSRAARPAGRWCLTPLRTLPSRLCHRSTASDSCRRSTGGRSGIRRPTLKVGLPGKVSTTMTLPLFALGLALVLTNADPGPSSPASAAAPAAIEARGDRFTVWAREASLQLILERIGEIAQIKMHIEGLAEERITVEFQDVPLEDALRRLLHRRSVVLVFENIAGSLVAVR